MKRFNCLFILCFALSPLTLDANDPLKSRPNIVLVMIDDLGAEGVECYGGESYKTPHMDALAKRGMKFENAYAMPACMVSRATLLSGRYGFRSGLPKNIDSVARTNGGWGKNETTVANLLQDAGYTTAISGKWHLAQIDRFPNHVTEKGFERQNLWGWIKGEDRTRRYWESTYYREKSWVTDPPGVYGPDVFCQYIIDFMKEQKDSDKPFFAYYPMVLLHSPWPQTPDNINDPQQGWKPEDNLRIPETQKWSQQNFNAMVEYADKVIGRIVKAIDDLDLAEDTLLIVTSDNGTISKVRSKYQGKIIQGGKMRATEQGARVPFFASWKGKIKPGSVNNNLIDFSDILPTLVELANSEVPADLSIDGKSFLDQLLDKPNPRKRDWIFAGYGTQAIVRSDQYILNAKDELFDITKDRYQPIVIAKQKFSEQDKKSYDQLKSAMESLNHPYTGKNTPRRKKRQPAKQ
jgi:arylsulfatase A